MNSLLDSHQASYQTDPDMRSQGDRELTLGTTMILGIFFALAVLCAVFFGFGYSMGSKHSAAALPVAAAASIASSTFNGFKPSPGSPLAAGAPKAPSPETVVVPYTPPTAASRPVPQSAAQSAAQPVNPDGETRPAPHTADAPAPAAALSPSQIMVQVAAVSHQEDADLIASTLTRRGYAVAIRSEPQDKLLHVQIGPFAARKDAEAMRQRLLADGFNAYIK